jgi:hypothetical protein
MIFCALAECSAIGSASERIRAPQSQGFCIGRKVFYQELAVFSLGILQLLGEDIQTTLPVVLPSA